MDLISVLLSGFLIGTTIFIVFLLSLPSRYEDVSPSSIPPGPSSPSEKRRVRFEEPKTSVQILVLGDIGRSPRMQYHAISIAKKGGRVVLIGYRDSEVHPDLLQNHLVTIIPIPPPPSILKTDNKSLFLLYGPLKVLWQIWSLWIILGYRSRPTRWLLVQNPPSIPTLAVAGAICLLRNTHLLIDWHNFGWSILALKLGSSHPLVRISKWYEYFFGGLSTANFTVTDAMARVLRDDYHLTSPIVTLHDRPPADFQALSAKDRSEFLHYLPETISRATAIESKRTRLLVSSTSWTADEDFSVLLDALITYCAPTDGSNPDDRPNILAIITGKGPMKAHYKTLIQEATDEGRLEKVTVMTAWLSTADYASLLGAADLGVSLHTSSSGVDLPMKVVDMFGAGLPVLGWNRFEAWPELVQEGVNGRGFESSDQLAHALVELFDRKGTELAKLREGALREGKKRWDDVWDPVAGRILGLCD